MNTSLLYVIFTLSVIHAFSPATSKSRTTTKVSASRRAFLDTAFVGAVLVSGASPAFAEGFDDLSMPTEDEQKAEADAAYQEKLRKKAELQKKKAQPRSFTDSFKNEAAKQKEFGGKSKEELRNAMCEELGRGC